MAVCLMNQIDTNVQRFDKFSLKLLGIGRFDLTDEEILETLSKYVEPRVIEGLLFDSFHNFYVLFLNDLNATCSLVGKKIKTNSRCINIYPLLECYVIDNVYPCLRNDDLGDIFRTFGNVFSVSNHHVMPNSRRFSHVLSGKREITFLLPGEELEIYIPINVLHPPYSFTVKKFCCACLTEGHSLLYCPDIEDDKDLKVIKHNESDSDSELEALIKNENIDFNVSKVEDSLHDTLPVDGTSKPDESEIAIVNSEKDVDIIQDEAVKDVPQEEKHPKSEIINTNNLTEVVSTSKGSYFRATDSVCRFAPGVDVVSRHVAKRGNVLLPPLAEEIINEVCGTCIIEANVFKQLILTDGRLKAEMIKFAFSYLEDVTHLLKLLKKVLKQCYADKKYVSLRDQFTHKVKRIHSVLYRFSKKK